MWKKLAHFGYIIYIWVSLSSYYGQSMSPIKFIEKVLKCKMVYSDHLTKYYCTFCKLVFKTLFCSLC